MQQRRIGFIILAFYFVFLGGSAYYTLLLPVRILHHALVTILLGLWLANRLRTGRGIPTTPLNAPIFATIAAWTAAAFFSLDPRMAFEHLWFLLLHIIIFFVLVDLFQRGRGKLIMETQFLLGAMVVMISSIELASWYFGLGIGGYAIGWFGVIGPGAWLPLELPPRLTWAMNNSNWVGSYAAPMVALAIGWALTMRRRDFRDALFMLAAALTIVMLLTQSRGAVISLGVALGTLTALRLAQSPSMRTRVNPALFLGGTALIGAAGVLVFVLLMLNPGRASGDLIRMDMYRSALKMTVDHPVTGVGPGMYGRAYREYRDPLLARDRLSAAHNIYLHTAAETGLLGAGVAFWMLGAFGWAWRRRWLEATSSSGRLRLETVLAVLLGLAVHNIVDVFITTPMLLLVAVLVAYGITGQRDILDESPPGQRIPALILLVALLGYGVWFIQLDRAQLRYHDSLRGGPNALEDARAAVEIDPGLNLYRLNVAYLLGQRAMESDPDYDDDLLHEAIAAYQDALELEPTWDVGWMNLAALALRARDYDSVPDYLENAASVNLRTAVTLNIARFYEHPYWLPEDELIDLYYASLNMQRGTFPLSDFWTVTVPRREALQRFAEEAPVYMQYRIWRAHDPDLATSIIQELDPVEASDLWAAGDYALVFQDDRETARRYFDEAIASDRRNGDFYVARARATIQTDPDSARRDLNIARMLGTTFEQPEILLAELTDDPDERRDLLIAAVPPRVVDYGFVGVSFGGRTGPFDLLPEMRLPGPGRQMMNPWYILAEEALEAGQQAQAMSIYRGIIAHAPGEIDARMMLERLESD